MVKAWLNGQRTVHRAMHVISATDAHADYDQYCKAHGEAPVSKGCAFTNELRRLGIEVRDKEGSKRGSEIVGLALTGGLRVVSAAR